MVTVLWVSRHNLVPAQIEELQRKLGKDVQIVQLSGFVPNAEYVIAHARQIGADYIIPVLPLSFIARLCELAKKCGITVLWSQMRLIHSGCPGPDECPMFDPHTDNLVPPARHYRFDRFYVIRGVVLELEDF